MKVREVKVRLVPGVSGGYENTRRLNEAVTKAKELGAKYVQLESGSFHFLGPIHCHKDKV
jgi:hypothetical protein